VKKTAILIVLLSVILSIPHGARAEDESAREYPIGTPGVLLTYKLEASDIPESVVRQFELRVGPVEERQGTSVQWIQLNAEKENKQKYAVWFLCSAYPSAALKEAENVTVRYLVSAGKSSPVEFIDEDLETPILPNTGAWQYLLPRTDEGDSPLSDPTTATRYLGHKYVPEHGPGSALPVVPEDVRKISLRPDLLIGVPHNAKVKNETRRWDESDYEYVALTRDNYSEMIAHGMNVFNVNPEQAGWIEDKGVYYWGVGGGDISYPEHLYRSNYLGPAIFFDEPMVHTRDQVFRPKFKEDPALRKRVTPEMFFEEFKKEYHEAKYERSPTQLLRGLAQREDVDLGDMDFLQQNVYSWETMISSAAYQLSEGGDPTPAAIVFEPPGRLGARRVLPELNASFACQIPTDDPKNLFGIVKGFARGAARTSGKKWGVSIYGAVVRSEAYWYMTHAYEHGATHFFFWDSYQLAAVPYGEYLSLSKNLRAHARNFPRRDLEKVNHAAEVAIVLPAGYNLGHVKMGIGNISGLPELNMERLNSHGVKYRDVMGNFYVEIERYIRLGVEYDLFWALDNLDLSGYREIVTIRKDGKVDVARNGKTDVLDAARTPIRPGGSAPSLSVDIETVGGIASTAVTARATVSERSAPVYYTQGAGKDGVYRNTYVLWELYGPGEEDYTDFWRERWDVSVQEGEGVATAKIDFNIETPGAYRLRVSTSDVAGRSQVVWKDLSITE
jgi:hypothetical protein